MNSRAQKHTEQFRDSQDSLRGIYNADHDDPEVVNAHNQAYYASKAQHLKEQVKGSLESAKDTLLSAKDQVFGAPIKPIQGGMPGRNHPHPETLATTQERIYQADATAQIPLARSEIEKESIDSEAAKEKLEERMTPIEGMPGPGRYHPHPYNLENVGLATKAVDKVKMGLDSAKASLVSAKDATVAGLSSAQIAVQPALASAQTQVKSGVRRGKKMIWRKKVQPIEGACQEGIILILSAFTTTLGLRLLSVLVVASPRLKRNWLLRKIEFSHQLSNRLQPECLVETTPMQLACTLPSPL